ncbi:MAG TPA: CHAT domain-containing tetratricopeptide repeat protein, partial [Woeseiaceae bacterium]|nr:CHAT domain-containing tetratricopeptide repeat protein [Woeseiaceae bacterium]
DLYRGEADSRALAAMPETQASAALATALAINAGNMYTLQSQAEPAEAYYRQAITSAARAGDRRTEAEARTNLAWSAIRAGRHEDAAALLAESLSLFGAEARTELRKAVLAVGVNAREAGELDEAETQMQAAIGLYVEAGDAVGQGRALAQLGSTLLLAEEFEAARDAYLGALELADTRADAGAEAVADAAAGTEGGAHADGEILRHAHGGLARTYQAMGLTDAAVDEYARYFDLLGVFLAGWSTDQGRVAIIQDQAGMLDGYAAVASDLAEETGDFAPLRNATQKIRGSALACLIQSRQQREYRPPGHADGGRVLYGREWDYVQVEYAAAIDTAFSRDMMAQRTIDVELAPRSGALAFADHCAVPAAATTIDPDAPPMIEYYVGPDRLVVLVVADGAIAGAVVPVGRQELAGLVDDYLRAIDVDRARGIVIAATAAAGPAGETGDRDALAKRLHEILVAPVAAQLADAADGPLVIVPHDVLWRLPFAALADAEGRWFGDRFRLSYITSQDAWNLLAAKPRAADHEDISAWVAGNPAMPQRVVACGEFVLEGLPGAEAEARAIEAILGAGRTELFLGHAADRLRLDAWHGDYSVIHLATHGVACPDDPLSSFIALADLDGADIRVAPDYTSAALAMDPRLEVQLDLAFDPRQVQQAPTPAYPGVLTARQVAEEYALDADLVTLSACQSGLGQLSGEGMIGFARAFLAAGARSLVVSLWKVDDDATQALMTAFYEEYAAHGDKGLALQQAMRAVRERRPDPRYWAGFVLLGLQE